MRLPVGGRINNSGVTVPTRFVVQRSDLDEVHRRLGERLRYSCAVGADQAAKRTAQWGPAGPAERIGAA